jgi:hypothetical protein
VRVTRRGFLKGVLSTVAVAALPKVKMVVQAEIPLVSVVASRASARLEEFTLAINRQGIPMLDNFGISSGRIRHRVEALQKQQPFSERGELFKQAVLEEALERA